jgi:hypothetical protein
MKPTPLETIIQNDVEAAGHRDDELMQSQVRMATTLGAPWDVVQVVHTLDVKGDLAAGLDKRQVASRVVDLG